MKNGRTGIANGNKRRNPFFRYCKLCECKFKPYTRAEKLCPKCFRIRTRRIKNIF